MQKKIKMIAALIAICLLAGTLLCSCNQNKDENNIPENDTVLTANGHDVSYGLYRYFFLNYKSDYTAEEISASPETVYAEIQKAAFDSIAGVYAVVDLCAEYGITTEDASIKESVDQTISSIKEQYIDEEKDKTGDKGFKEDLKSNFMTEEVLRFVTAVDACESALFTRLLAETDKIPSGEEALKEAIYGDEFIRVLQIYISADNGSTYEENKALAQKVYNLAVGNHDFDALVADYSNDYTMTKNGYYICHGYMSEEFEAAAYALNVGEMSEILELSDGFHIIKRFEKDNGYLAEHFEDLAEQYQTCKFYEIVDKKQATVKIEKNDKFAEIDPALISLK